MYDGLKFMNERKEFMQEMMARREKSRTVAGKITEGQTGSREAEWMRNPRLYKGVEASWVGRIPQAGRPLPVGDHVAQIL